MTTKPETKIKVGAVTSTVWKNTIKGPNGEVEVRNVVVERSYKDKDDQWKTTNSFKAQDLPKVD